jgi:hypothetical protein
VDECSRDRRCKYPGSKLASAVGGVSAPEDCCIKLKSPRYAFRREQKEGQPIEIEDEDDFVDPSRKFYWNPYSGELSLTFPTSNTKSKGGILADAMGERVYV